MEERLSVQSLAHNRTPVDISNGMHIFTRLSIAELIAGPISNTLDDGEQNELHVPFTGFGYSIHEDSWIFNVAREFNLYRLDDVSQLEYLEDPREQPNQLGTSVRFAHTRYRHSSNVCAIVLAIAEVNREWFAKRLGYREALLVASLTHDVLTPAGGDTTKAIDREGFDEDAQYHTCMTQERREFFLKHGVDPELCIRTVQGDGVLGTILDIADKLAYVGHDLVAFAGLPLFGHLEYVGFARHLRKNLLFCSIWESIRIENEEVWCEDADGLTRFLIIRAQLFRQLYTHPKARYREALLMFQTLSFLYEEGILTREQLLHMTDGDLRIFLEKKVNWRPDRMLPSKGHFTPKHRRFKNLTDAKKFEVSLLREGRLFVRQEDLTKVFKPTHHFKVRKGTQIGTLQKLFPEFAKRIESAGQTIDPIRVSYLEGYEPHLGVLTEAFKLWQAKKLITT